VGSKFPGSASVSLTSGSVAAQLALGTVDGAFATALAGADTCGFNSLDKSLGTEALVAKRFIAVVASICPASNNFTTRTVGS
jgi:hypothetical protein